MLGKALVVVVRRVVEEVCGVGSLRSSVAVDGSDSSSALEVEEDTVRVEALVGEDKALVEEALVVATGIEELRGPLGLPPFVQSLALSLHTYPRSQHRPDRQMGPPLQDPPLHTG